MGLVLATLLKSVGMASDVECLADNSPQDDAISICASSKHLQTQRFLDTLRAYLLEVQRMLQQLYREANAKPATLVSPPLGDLKAFLTEPIYSRSRDKRKKRTLMAGMASTRARSAPWTRYSRSDVPATEVSVPRSQLRTTERFTMYLSFRDCSLVFVFQVVQQS